jgi:hypothetical protein
MSNRVLGRAGARELTREELEQVNGATGTGCRGTMSHFVNGGRDEDILCEPVV